MHLLVGGIGASELKGASPDGQLMFECMREEKPGAESHLYLWEKSKPENRKLVSTFAFPVTGVEISPDGTWIAVLAELPRPYGNLALLHRVAALEYQRVTPAGENLVRQFVEEAYRNEYQHDLNPYQVSAKVLELSVQWSPDSKKLDLFLNGKFFWGTTYVESESRFRWRGDLTVETMSITSVWKPRQTP